MPTYSDPSGDSCCLNSRAATNGYAASVCDFRESTGVYFIGGRGIVVGPSGVRGSGGCSTGSRYPNRFVTTRHYADIGAASNECIYGRSSGDP